MYSPEWKIGDDWGGGSICSMKEVGNVCPSVIISLVLPKLEFFHHTSSLGGIPAIGLDTLEEEEGTWAHDNKLPCLHSIMSESAQPRYV